MRQARIRPLLTLLLLPAFAPAVSPHSNLLLKIEFAGATYYSCGASGLGSGEAAAAGPAAAPCHSVPDLQAALQLPTDPNASPALELGVLFGMLVALRLLVYYTLRQKTKAA